MSKLCLNTWVENSEVTVEFYWYGESIDWASMAVYALLPSSLAPEGKRLVKINDLLSDEQWNKIETDIYLNEDKLRKQFEQMEY